MELGLLGKVAFTAAEGVGVRRNGEARWLESVSQARERCMLACEAAYAFPGRGLQGRGVH